MTNSAVCKTLPWQISHLVVIILKLAGAKLRLSDVGREDRLPSSHTETSSNRTSAHIHLLPCQSPVLCHLIQPPLCCHFFLVNNNSRKSVLHWDTSQQRNNSSHTSRNTFWESRGGDAIEQWHFRLLLTSCLVGEETCWGPFPRHCPCPVLLLAVITKLSTIIKWKMFPSCTAVGKSLVSGPVTKICMPKICMNAHIHIHTIQIIPTFDLL